MFQQGVDNDMVVIYHSINSYVLIYYLDWLDFIIDRNFS